jgi:hypothetical protein
MPESVRRERASFLCGRARLAARRVGIVGAALSAGYLSVTGCDYSSYPIEASFCDDWCRTLRRTDCDQEPENCIRDCESALPSDRCQPLQASLLSCYAAVPPDQFECVGQGFQATVRPRPEICTLERDELISCEVPRVMDCIDVCRELDASDPFASPRVPTSDGMLVAPSEDRVCPESPLPCERLCWVLDARFGRGEAERGMRVTATSDVDLAALGEPLIRCAQEGARVCREETALETLAGARVSWTSLFFECTGLPGDFELFD